MQGNTILSLHPRRNGTLTSTSRQSTHKNVLAYIAKPIQTSTRYSVLLRGDPK